MSEKPTTATPPETGTGQATGLELIERMSQEVMENMAKSVSEKVPVLETSNRLQGVGIKQEQESEANGQEGVQETQSQENSQEVTEENQEQKEQTEETPEAEPLDKRLKDAQSMIGRQANEIGQLRKTMEEFKKQQEAIQKPAKESEEPYYEKLVKASEDDIANLLIQDAQRKGESLEPYLAKQQAKTLKMTAQTQLDIVRDALKPIKEMAEQAEQAKLIAQKDAEWYATHPDFASRKDAITAFIKDAYPDGLNGVDPYIVAHTAYVYAGKLAPVAKSNAEAENNKRIVNARSLNVSNKGAVQAGATMPKQKINPVQAEAERVWEQLSPTILRQG